MRAIFNTTQSDLTVYNGSIVIVLGELEDWQYDKEDLGEKMFYIDLNGTMLQAFEDELTIIGG